MPYEFERVIQCASLIACVAFIDLAISPFEQLVRQIELLSWGTLSKYCFTLAATASQHQWYRS